MQTIKHSAGFTLIELMVTVGILGVLAAIAIPAYTGYIETGDLTVAKRNAVTLAGFEETYYYENDTYLAGSYDPSTATDDLTGKLEWVPTSDEDNYKYLVEAGSCAEGIFECLKITVTHVEKPLVTETITRP